MELKFTSGIEYEKKKLPPYCKPGKPLANWSRMKIGDCIRIEDGTIAKKIIKNAAQYGCKLSQRYVDKSYTACYLFRVEYPDTLTYFKTGFPGAREYFCELLYAEFPLEEALLLSDALTIMAESVEKAKTQADVDTFFYESALPWIREAIQHKKDAQHEQG